ncbi:response regulator [Leptothoe kymatousa]|uniref:Response regulator n=1 Tax=Leptothoe kymatousa TAU-MAC 1615 TaxID=2364775 RepID=A0ABS5Y3T6_9CYAN|nr:response regulator [Leptothoe kymatousa]MBT9312029.1 response regulator [Leptothoe kymatousa TAU-MAC 1615]
MVKKILVIDDVKSELDLISHYLEEAGYVVTGILNGLEAIDKIQSDRPDVIVTDLVMPDITGLELCRKLKKEPSTADIPIVACTTKDRKMDKSWAKKQGVVGYVVKPCTAEQLVDAVRSATM